MSSTPCQPIQRWLCPSGAAPLRPSSSSWEAPGLCCWQGVLGDAHSAPAICALCCPLNHGDLHGDPMRPGISVPLCIKQHRLPCNLIVYVLNINQQAGLEQSKLLCSCWQPLQVRHSSSWCLCYPHSGCGGFTWVSLPFEVPNCISLMGEVGTCIPLWSWLCCTPKAM